MGNWFLKRFERMRQLCCHPAVASGWHARLVAGSGPTPVLTLEQMRQRMVQWKAEDVKAAKAALQNLAMRCTGQHSRVAAYSNGGELPLFTITMWVCLLKNIITPLPEAKMAMRLVQARFKLDPESLAAVACRKTRNEPRCTSYRIVTHQVGGCAWFT